MNQKNDAPRRFKNILINPPFQLKMMLYFVGLFVLTSASLYSTTFLFFWRLKDKAIKVGIPEGHVFFNFLSYLKQDLDNLFIGLASVNFLLLIGIGLVLSHRIAGPIHKLKKHLNGTAPASEPFKLRKGDFFQELEPIVNDVKDKVND